MIGLSLPYKWLLGDRSMLPPDRLLPLIKDHGANSVEIRAVPASADPNEVMRSAAPLLAHGLNITVHASVTSADDAVVQVLHPLEKLIENMKQRELIVTIHPIGGDNLRMLLNLSDYITEKEIPVRIALENERKMPDKTDGDSLALALDAVVRANRENVGICFDMGHFAWYSQFFTDSPHRLPPKEFLSRVIHTHIHACVDGRTHFPINEWKSPLSAYIEAIDLNYFGVYNLELCPDRFTHVCDAVEGYIGSLDALRENFPFSARLYESLKLNYDKLFHSALEVLDKNDGCYVSLVAPTAYLFNTNGYKWAMDIAFRNIRYLSDVPSRIGEYLKDVKLMILTHGHPDHMEKSTLRALAENDMTWLVPEFLLDDVTACGVRRDRIIVARVGESVEIENLKIRTLEGRHFRPENGSGIEAVGYFVESEGVPSMAFPGDVRDYHTEGLEELNADCCFAHVWLTDNAIDPEKYIPKSREMAEFALKMSRKCILLTHLYENGRDEMGMWQTKHAEVVADAICRISPDTKTYIPATGEIVHLK